MYSWVFIFLMGTLYTCSKVPVLGDDYIAELLVEGNFKLDAQSILSVLNTTASLQLNNTCAVNYTVTFLQVTAGCLVIGADTSCNCSTGYTWSNDVCYNYSCCNDRTCTANVSYITPLCVPKVNVKISGSAIITDIWNANKSTQLQKAFQGLNGFQYLNVTQSTKNKADFEAKVSVRIKTSSLQDIVKSLQTDLTADITVKVQGMVSMMSPNSTVCYKSSPVLKCTLEETTDSADWKLIKNQSIELNTGSVVKLDYSCAATGYSSCIALTLQNVTSAWVGTYECGFTTGSVTHTARAQLNVSLLPDAITMETSPLTADCSRNQTDIVPMNILTIIPQSTEKYEVWWSYSGTERISVPYTPSGSYTFNASISCQKPSDAQYVKVTFKNTKGQEKSAEVNIPVIYAGNKTCCANDTWPMTPAGVRLFNWTCAEDRVGYRSRTCDGPDWQDVYDYCVNKELNSVLNDAEDFLKGLGATQEQAKDIFLRLNSSTSDSSLNSADISASINILELMAMGSNNIVLKQDVLPNFLYAASNVVNWTWNAINKSLLHDMSSTYLQSVDNLVKNINVNMTEDVSSTNLEFKSCFSDICSMSVFDVVVNLEKKTGTLKTVAVKNLMDKLNNDYNDTKPTNLLLIATLQDCTDSSLKILLEYPDVQQTQNKPLCVFWNTTKEDWSDVGCSLSTNNKKHTCECNHLTPFSALLSNSGISKHNTALDIITNVGLSVSIISLLIFLTVECLVWSAVVKTNLAHFRHTAMVNITTFLMLADISMLASTSPDNISETWCLILTTCKHLFYLAMFCWMLCLSVTLVHQLIFVFSPLRRRVFMFISTIVGYALPILIVGSSYMYYKYTNNDYYDRKTCWLIYVRFLVGSMHAFLLPVGIIVFINLFCMTVIIVKFMKSSVLGGSISDDKVTAKGIVKVLAVLMPLFGVTWIIGYIGLTFPEGNLIRDVLDFCFTILNSFQGVFIFLIGCFTEHKIREELCRRIWAKSNEKTGSTKHFTSETCIKGK